MNDWWHKKQDDGQSKRLLWAIAVSGLILIGFDMVVAPLLGVREPAPVVRTEGAPAGTEAAQTGHEGATSALEGAADATASGGLGVATGNLAPEADPAVAREAVEVVLTNGDVRAVVDASGGRLVGWTLLQHGETIDDEDGYPLLMEDGPFAAQLELKLAGNGVAGPDATAWWDVARQGDGFVELKWRNGSGQTFTRQFVMDEKGYGLSVTDSVANTATLPVTFVPEAQLVQADGVRPGEQPSFVNYFGPMGVVGSGEELRVVEESFKDVKKAGTTDRVQAQGGWWGFTTHFFIAAMVPGDNMTQRWFAYEDKDGRDVTHAVVVREPMVVPAGGTTRTSMRLVLGPKEDGWLAKYNHNLGRAIDWGWFKVIAKPMHSVLVWLHGYLGNWGLAIIALTVLLKLVTFPLASKSYRAMAKMKNLAPEVEELKKRHGGDQQAMATQLMALYAREKVNPLSGCWPMLIQIPIFFAMYKVILVSFEFRHAPLGLWIHDLSVADPFYVLPVLMGASMWVQMQMQPPAADPVQQAVFKWMPVIFTVMFLWFPAGLVLYWLTNNVLSVAQQWMIMRGTGNGTTGLRNHGTTGRKG